ncbi:MAG: hypothetical protein HC884_03910 [Chloroflexaceae bacterium]|nr:hypothetical protein [Chloroflexaceae bacterium]
MEDNEALVRHGSGLLELMTMDPDTLWAALDEEERERVVHTLQQFDVRLAAATTEADLAGVASEVLRLVNDTPPLRDMLVSDEMKAQMTTMSGGGGVLGGSGTIAPGRRTEYARAMRYNVAVVLHRPPGGRPPGGRPPGDPTTLPPPPSR